MSKISTYIIAYNEAEKIKDAINSVLWTDEIIVVDSHSSDGTDKIAESMGAKVIQFDFQGFGDLRNKAIAVCSCDWIFSLDSDERCTQEAKDEMISIVNSDDPKDAYFVPRKNYFMGKWVKHSGFFPDYRQPQLFRKGILKFRNDPVHEAYNVLSDKVGYMVNPIWQVPYKNLSEVVHKANRYSTLGADKLEKENMRSSMFTAFGHALWKFISLYIFKLGLLDGWAGFVIAFGNFEGTFYKYAKFHEKQSKWKLPKSLPITRD